MSARTITATLMVLLLAGIIGFAVWSRGHDDAPRKVEARELAQIVLPDEATAHAVERQLAAGADFAAVAAEQRSDAYWKIYTHAEFRAITSPAVADAAFRAPVGGYSKAAASDYGWHVVQVVKVFPAHR